jgi:4-hydroxy-2-oxoheptanedioate aldolase
MIESREGLENVEEIARTPNLDVLFVGPYDLSLSLGIIEEFENPVFWKALDRVVAAAKSAGIAVGLQSGNMELVLKARAAGVRFVIYSSDVGVLMGGYTDAMKRLKSITNDNRVSY